MPAPARTYAVPDLPTDVASSLGHVVRRLDLQVTVHRYGPGRPSSVSADPTVGRSASSTQL
jgi:hypothetical protein